MIGTTHRFAFGPFHEVRGPRGGLWYTAALKRDLDTGLSSVVVTERDRLPRIVVLGFLSDSAAVAAFRDFVSRYESGPQIGYERMQRKRRQRTEGLPA